MTELFEPGDAADPRLALRAVAGGGLLGAFNAAGLLTAADVHVATRVAVLGEEDDEHVALAVALAVRAVRRGSVGLDLAAAPAVAPDLPWPEPADWDAAVAASPLLAAGVLRREHGLVYLDRYHRLEVQVADDLAVRLAQPEPEVDTDRLEAALTALGTGHFNPQQRDAAARAVRGRTTILTGGPGTGKTTTVARVLVLLADQAHGRGERLSIAVAAPTGKAATRLTEAIAEELAALAADPGSEAATLAARVPTLTGVTLHRLLGWRGDNQTRFRHDRTDRLGHDVVVVDESSMVDLTLMGRLLEAVRPQARLLLVGDPQQLTSVGAGAVLGDVVDALGGADGAREPVAALTVNHRSTAHINDLAERLRAGDADGVLEVLARGTEEVQLLEVADADEAAERLRETCLVAGRTVRDAARRGDVAAALAGLDEHRLLCAHRDGPWGAGHWNRLVERWLLADDEERGVAPTYGPFGVGRPLLVTQNDYALDLYNGDTGVVVPVGTRTRAVFAGGREVAPGRLAAVETMHAMTVHKSQGSQAGTVTVLLPDADSRLLTRELFYTAVTRAQRSVRVVASPDAVRVAVATRADRATGLAARLRGVAAEVSAASAIRR